MLEEGLPALAALPLGVIFVGREVCQVVGEEALTSVVEDALRALLQQLQRVDRRRPAALLAVVVVDDDGRGQRLRRVRGQRRRRVRGLALLHGEFNLLAVTFTIKFANGVVGRCLAAARQRPWRGNGN